MAVESSNEELCRLLSQIKESQRTQAPPFFLKCRDPEDYEDEEVIRALALPPHTNISEKFAKFLWSSDCSFLFILTIPAFEFWLPDILLASLPQDQSEEMAEGQYGVSESLIYMFTLQGLDFPSFLICGEPADPTLLNPEAVLLIQSYLKYQLSITAEEDERVTILLALQMIWQPLARGEKVLNTKEYIRLKNASRVKSWEDLEKMIKNELQVHNTLEPLYISQPLVTSITQEPSLIYAMEQPQFIRHLETILMASIRAYLGGRFDPFEKIVNYVLLRLTIEPYDSQRSVNKLRDLAEELGLTSKDICLQWLLLVLELEDSGSIYSFDYDSTEIAILLVWLEADMT